MAADTRKQSDRDEPSADAQSSNAGAGPYNGPNMMARQNDLSLIDAAKTIKLEDFRTFHEKPCVRNALLTGIGLGFGVGGVRAIFGASIPKASNWATGTFILAAFGQYQYCQLRRRLERDGLRRAMEIMDRKREEKEARTQEQKEARRLRKLEAERKSEEAREAQRKRSRSTAIFGEGPGKDNQHDQRNLPTATSWWRFWETGTVQVGEAPKAEIKRSPFWNMTPDELEKEVNKQKRRAQEESARGETGQQMVGTQNQLSPTKGSWKFW